MLLSRVFLVSLVCCSPLILTQPQIEDWVSFFSESANENESIEEYEEILRELQDAAAVRLLAIRMSTVDGNTILKFEPLSPDEQKKENKNSMTNSLNKKTSVEKNDGKARKVKMVNSIVFEALV